VSRKGQVTCNIFLLQGTCQKKIDDMYSDPLTNTSAPQDGLYLLRRQVFLLRKAARRYSILRR